MQNHSIVNEPNPKEYATFCKSVMDTMHIPFCHHSTSKNVTLPTPESDTVKKTATDADGVMNFNYYSFWLRGKERIYYTYVTNDTEEEILDWAIRFGFIDEEDKEQCSNVRALSPAQVQERNKALYRDWWDEHKNDDTLSGKIPPTIGEAQLN